DADRFANNAWVASEKGLPGAVAEDGIGALSRSYVFRLVEETPQRRLDGQHIKIVAGGEISPDAECAGVRLQLHGRDAVSQHACEGAVGVAKILIVGKGLAGAVTRVFDESQFVRAINGEGAEEESVDYAEDNRVGADAESQGKDRDKGEGRIFRQHTNRVAQVLQQATHLYAS